MNVKDITEQTMLLVEKPLSMAYVRKYINEAVKVLAATYDTAYYIDKTTIECTDILEDYVLPSNCIGVVKVFDTLNDNIRYKDYTVINGYINFQDKGTYLVRFYRLPNDLINREVYDMEIGDDIPELSLLYHQAIPYFVAAKILLSDESEDAANKSNVFMQTFNDLVSKANIKINNMKRGNRRIKAPLWR